MSVYTAMALNIRSQEANALAAEVSALAGETKTDAVIHALRERRDRLLLLQEAGLPSPESLVDRLTALPARFDHLPCLDPRGANEILGYDANGLPQG